MRWRVKHIENKWAHEVEAKNGPEALKLALEAQKLPRRPPGTITMNIIRAAPPA